MRPCSSVSVTKGVPKVTLGLPKPHSPAPARAAARQRRGTRPGPASAYCGERRCRPTKYVTAVTAAEVNAIQARAMAKPAMTSDG
jgi:hypothetical protein